jgi:gamma-glutamyl-gamma-aminobutyrate hydrolase PuuD
VQWHPEYDFQHDAASLAIFTAFRDAVRAHATQAFASAAD